MPAESSHLPLAIGLAMLCALIETVEQLLYRVAGRDDKRYWSHVAVGTVLHVAYLVVWLLLLRLVPLSTALPMMGLQYVTIALAAKVLFGEKVDLRRWIGIAVIVIGFVLVAGHTTE